MLVILERYPETQKLKELVKPQHYEKIAEAMEGTPCPVLVDIETGILREITLEYTGKSYNMVFRVGEGRAWTFT